MPRTLLTIASAFCLCVNLLTSPALQAAQDGQGFTVVLVRHAEKESSEEDPALSSTGQQRAQKLASLLQDAGIEQIWSSDYRRTRDTAAPLSTLLGIEVLLYDPRNLPGLVDRLRRDGHNALVVGHSNTTPELASLLGGETHGTIDEKTEYDRLYLLNISKATTTTTLLRYGQTADQSPK